MEEIKTERMDTKLIKQKILDLAIRGKLVPQNPADEPASVLLERIKAEKAQLIKEGKIKKEKELADNESPDVQLPASWEWAKINDIFIFKGGYAFKSKDYSTSEVNQIIRIGNVKNDCLLLNNQPVYVSKEIVQKAEDYKIQLDDLLFTMTGTKGKRDYFFTCLVEEKHLAHDLYLNQRVGCLRSITAKVYLPYISLALKHNIVLDAIFATETGNVSQGNIGSYSTLNLYIPLPPLEEQKRIVAEIDRWFKWIDELEQNQQDLHIAIKQAKSKILDLAIHGKLVPQESKWKEYELKEVCDFLSGYAFDSNEYKTSGIPLVRISNIKNSGIDLEQCVFIQKSIEDRFIIKKGDLLIAMSGATTGKMGIYRLDSEAALNQRVGNLRVKDTSLLLPEYRDLYMLAQQELILKLAYGGAQPNISAKNISSFKISLPTIVEQKKIIIKTQSLFAQLDCIEKCLG